MFAQAEAGGNVAGMAGMAGMADPYTRQFGTTGQHPIPSTDQMPGPVSHPPVNPYGSTGQSYPHGMSPEAAERYRSKAFRLTTMSTVGVMALMGFSVWASTRAQNHAGQMANNAANNIPTFSMPSIPALNNDPSTPSAADTGTSSTAAGQSLLTPAGIRGVVTRVLAASGGTKVASLTVYDDHASFDVMKKTDPTVYDTWSYDNGQPSFSMTGSTLDQGQEPLDPTKVDWSVIPALLKDANSTLNVKNPTYHYVIVDFNTDDNSMEIRVYVGDDYRSGYLAATMKGKVLRRYPQE
jgi:hypothetical protein